MELKFTSFAVETITPQFLLNGRFQPRGDLFIYLNDRRHLFFHFSETVFRPMLAAYQVNPVKLPDMNISWRHIVYMSLLEEDILENLQILQSKRPVAFYTDRFAIRGALHVNPDAHEQDLVDETRDFLVVTDAMIYPLRPVKAVPSKKAPLLALNRHHILGYHIVKPKDTP